MKKHFTQEVMLIRYVDGKGKVPVMHKVDLEIDLDGIFQSMGQRAVYNKSQSSLGLGGLIVADVKEVKS